MGLLYKEGLNPYQGMFFEVYIKVDSPTPIEGKCTFQKVTTVSEETEYAEYRSGDDPGVKRQIPGLTSFGDVVLEDGLDPDSTIRRWRNLILKGNYNEGAWDKFSTSGHNYKASGYGVSHPYGTIEITLFAPDGHELHAWKVIRATCSAVSYGDIDASSSDVIVRSATIKNEGIIENESKMKL